MVDGAFDPLHHGHIEYFNRAKEVGGMLLCNIAPDSYTAVKHPPLLAAPQRAAVLDALKPIDYTHISPVDTETVLRELQPTHYIKGKDWEGRLPPEQVRICEKDGIQIVYLDTVLRVLRAKLGREPLWMAQFRQAAWGRDPEACSQVHTRSFHDTVNAAPR